MAPCLEINRAMSSASTPYDPGIQAVRSDCGIEVDGRGTQHQPYDRNAPLEDTEAHFQAEFRPDHERGEETPNNFKQEPRHSNERTEASAKRSKLLARCRVGENGKRCIHLWLYLALLVMFSLAIAASILAERFAHSRFVNERNNKRESSN